MAIVKVKAIYALPQKKYFVWYIFNEKLIRFDEVDFYLNMECSHKDQECCQLSDSFVGKNHLSY